MSENIPEARRREVDQHIGWLKMYLDSMSERNWRDMRLYADRQLGRLEATLDAIRSSGKDRGEE
jgi:hypothetical protein